MQDFVIAQNAFARFLAHFNRVVAWDNLKIVTVRLNPAVIGAAEHFKADNLPQSTVGNIKMHHYFKILFELVLKAVDAVDRLVQLFQKGRIFIGNQLVEKVLLIAEVFIDSSLAYVSQGYYFIERSFFIAMLRKTSSAACKILISLGNDVSIATMKPPTILNRKFFRTFITLIIPFYADNC